MDKINYTKYGYIDFSNMKIYRGGISWKDSENVLIKFKYKDIIGEFVYLCMENNKVLINYKDEVYLISKNSLYNNKIDRIVCNRINTDFIYKINDIIRDENRYIEILDEYRIDSYRIYFVKCLICGYEYEVRESALSKGCNCPVCTNHKVVKGINDFGTQYPQLAKYIVNEEDKYLKVSSSKKIKWKCPNCNGEYHDTILKVLQRGLKCSLCEDKYSFGETCMLKLFSLLSVDYEHHKTFKWSQGREYDFYIPSLRMIIEVHGMQHYSRGFESLGGRTLEEEQENDKTKELLAKENDISNYIIIDCRYSKINWFKENVLKSKLFSIFNLTNIEWDSFYDYSTDSAYLQVCDLYKKGYNLTEIESLTQIERHYVSKLLNYANNQNELSYTKEDIKKIRAEKTSNKISKPIRCNDTGQVFKSLAELKNNSVKAFGFYVSGNNIARQIKLNKKHFGLSFEYISKEEFNRIKLESPELSFGDSFVL